MGEMSCPLVGLAFEFEASCLFLINRKMEMSCVGPLG